MSKRRDALRAYLLEVTREMIGTGTIRSRRGDSLEHILSGEGARVVAGVLDDLRAIGTEMGFALVPAIGQGAHDLLDQGLRHVVEMVTGARR